MSLVNHTVQIVHAFLTRNEIATQEVSGLIQEVHRTLTGLVNAPETQPVLSSIAKAADAATEIPQSAAQATEEIKRQPAVPINQAVTHEDIACLLCGQRVKTLRGHLTRSHSMESNEYREIFGLDKNFPMVAPAYSDKRRKLALDSGLSEKLRAGRRRKQEAG